MKPAARWTGKWVLSIEKYTKSYALKEGLWHGHNPNNTDWDTAISDIVADLMHVADKHGVDWDEVVRRADNHHSAERMFRCKKCGLRMDESQGECPECHSEELVFTTR